MVYKIKMNKQDYFKINNKIISNNLEIDGDDVYFEVESGSYQIIKKSNYKYKIVESLQSRIIRFVSKNSLIIVGVLFLFSVLYMNLYRVTRIDFNRETPINDEIEYKIKSSYRKLFFFDFCSLNYEKLSKELRVKYPEYPYIEVDFDHNVINVTIYNYDEVSYDNESIEEGDVIAKKDGIVDVFYVYNGQNMVSKNQYVKSGDILISGTIVEKYVQASGLVMATTYDKVVIEIPKSETISRVTMDSETYFQINLFSLNFNLGKDNDFSNYLRNETTTFNLFDFFNVKKIEDIKKNDIIVSYSYEDALKKAKETIENDFSNRKINALEKIIDMASIKYEETDECYTFTFIVKKYESIGIFRSY